MSRVVPPSSKGKKFAPPKRIQHVEDQPCPGRDGLHLLTNREAVTLCVGCRVDWPTLDAELNRRTA